MSELDRELVSGILSQLTARMPGLNAAREALSTTIHSIEDRLKLLNLGLSAWVLLSQTTTSIRELGYGKNNSKWGLLLRTRGATEVFTNVETWHYCDGPLWLRIDAVSHIPDLLAKLLVNAAEQEKKLFAVTENAKLLEELFRKEPTV